LRGGGGHRKNSHHWEAEKKEAEEGGEWVVAQTEVWGVRGGTAPGPPETAKKRRGDPPHKGPLKGLCPKGPWISTKPIGDKIL